MTVEREFEPAEIVEDTGDEDAVPVDVDEVPDVREDEIPGEDDASTSSEPPTEDQP
jgi:hypothetical protein